MAFSKVVDPKIMERWFPRQTQIAQVELMAIAIAFDLMGEELAGKRVISLVDSESALGAAVKGYSRKADISDMTTHLWDTISRNRINVFFDRISTDANISDGPSRNEWRVANDHNWNRIDFDWPEAYYRG